METNEIKYFDGYEADLADLESEQKNETMVQSEDISIHIKSERTCISTFFGFFCAIALVAFLITFFLIYLTWKTE